MGVLGLAGVMALIGLVGAGEPAKPTVGLRLQDHRGAWHTLDEARDRKVVVLAFLGTECPLAEAYAPRLAELARDFGKQGVAFFGVDANTGKTLWLSEGRQAGNAAIVKAGNVLFSLEDDGELIVLRSSQTAFQPLRRYKVADSETWAQPAISGNRIFVKDLTSLTLWTLN